MKRRDLIKLGLASVGGALAAQSLKAQEICENLQTPAQPIGPFYPRVDQIDEDSDLVVVTGKKDIARGKIVIVQGKVTDQFCAPVEGVLVEIWQACETGKYNHRSDPNPAPLDPNFQYWGQAVTDAEGNYRFRTIIPGAYPASSTWMRPPHIHFRISRRGYRELITQMYFEGEIYNETDLYVQAMSLEERKQVIVGFRTEAGLPHPVGQFPIQITKIG